MANYNKFYNAWQTFAKPKRQLLVENEVPVPVVDSQLEVGPNEHSFKVKVNSETFIKLTSDDKTKANIQTRADKITDFDPAKAEQKMYLRLDANGKVLDHEGRARNQRNVDVSRASGKAAELNIEIIIPKNLSLSVNDIPNVRGQAGMADNVVVQLGDLIPYFTLTPDQELANKQFETALKDAKAKVTPQFVFIQKYYPHGRDRSFTAIQKLNAIIGTPYTTFTAVKIASLKKSDPKKYDDVVKGKYRYALDTKQAEPVREEFAELMNKHFDIQNDSGQKFIISSKDAGFGGIFMFSLEKEDGSPIEEKEVDKVIFKAK